MPGDLWRRLRRLGDLNYRPMSGDGALLRSEGHGYVYTVTRYDPESERETQRLREELICMETGRCIARITICMKHSNDMRIGWWDCK